MANPRLFRVALEVGDPAAAGRFYEALLGIAPRPVGGGRLYLDLGEVTLALIAADEVPHEAPEDLYFEVDGVEAYHERAAELGCLSAGEVHGESGGQIVVRPWGERSFYAEDPWGNGLCFVERGTRFTGR